MWNNRLLTLLSRTKIRYTRFPRLSLQSTYKLNLGLHFYSTDVQDKYRQKLLEKAKKEGFNTIEELQSHLKEQIEKKKKEFNKIDILKELEDYEQKLKMSSSLSSNAGYTKSKGPLDPNKPKAPFKTLDSYLATEKIKDLSKQEVEFLWRARWAEVKDSLCAVVPVDVFNKMLVNVRGNPIFVLPLPRVLDPSKTANEPRCV